MIVTVGAFALLKTEGVSSHKPQAPMNRSAEIAVQIPKRRRASLGRIASRHGWSILHLSAVFPEEGSPPPSSTADIFTRERISTLRC